MMTEKYIKVNGIKICCQIQGEGKPLILIHGFAMYKEIWLAQIFDLSKNFQVITLDLRNSGNSSHPEESYEMEAFVEDMKALMDHLKIDKAHIAGHSLGGMIAQNFALIYPDRLNKLILIATLPRFPGDMTGLEMYKKSQINSFRAKQENPIDSFYGKMKQRFTRKFFKEMKENPKKKFHGIFSTEDLIDLEIHGSSSITDIEILANSMGSHDTLAQLNQIQNDTLILVGEKDRFTPKNVSELMHEEIPNSVLKILPGGHFFPLENAPEVNKIIIDFLSD
ncbi:MAG: alpha/beta fold hydrolase [Candidatus Lokiarchaeota archaeon]|nr:alpha/beta fold hydrolase [Candidatus Lokiarchaeota archaeon]MBD3342328.1 alpha/beta fold hydrolase [Candidatus Lokiarchaeota archaeon]